MIHFHRYPGSQVLKELCRVSRSPRVQPRCLTARCYATTTTTDYAPSWFQTLRSEMLGRGTNTYRTPLDNSTHERLLTSLSPFIPTSHPRQSSNTVPIGHHLAWFNANVPSIHLLPDGTDALHSPGGPWTRRMWAGGSIQVDPTKYYSPSHGFALNSPINCAEDITDVSLRGQGDTAKIFVDIRRTYTRWASEPAPAPLMTETRQLVFLKDKSSAEKAAMKNGEFWPVKYIDPPKEPPTFAHTLLPTRHLLTQYSALTYNAHLIHLDRDYTRSTEGHRDLLVHGPLSLTLMLQVVTDYVCGASGGEHVVHSIRYRNLAPLYCGEEMKICGRLKRDGVYDVWIEGPTGGVAVKGVVESGSKGET